LAISCLSDFFVIGEAENLSIFLMIYWRRGGARFFKD
jgi:hypothetical protein